LLVATIGVGLGAGLAIVLSRVLASRIVFMRVFDAQACAAGVLLVVAAAFVAGYIPSRKAARADPMETLRGD
jgi:putative ABC transport system permease protein